MLKVSRKAIDNYFSELSAIDFGQFNKFIIHKIFANALRFQTVIPVLAVIGIIAFSFSLQDSFYIFIPQSNVTSFASYLLVACVASILLLVLYPLIIILILNYMADKTKNIFRKIFIPLKIIILCLAFYFCIVLITGESAFRMSQRIHIAFLWLLLYFTLINLYLSYSHGSGELKLTKIRAIFGMLFLVLMIKPFLIIFLFTSEKINYTSFNPSIYLSKENCVLVSSPITGDVDPHNLTINNTRLMTLVPGGGCYLHGNLIRYGFGSDYVIVFKKNIAPLKGHDNKYYNAYMRLNCYSGGCYADDNFFIESNNDEIGSLIEFDLARRVSTLANIKQAGVLKSL